MVNSSHRAAGQPERQLPAHPFHPGLMRPGPVIQRPLVIGPADHDPDQQVTGLDGRSAAARAVTGPVVTSPVVVLAYHDLAHRARGEPRLDLAVDQPLQLQ